MNFKPLFASRPPAATEKRIGDASGGLNRICMRGRGGGRREEKGVTKKNPSNPLTLHPT